jgi:hypothetical protein
MSLDIIKEKGIPLDQQTFNWRDLVRTPVSKLDEDAFTRLRIILLNGVESESVRFSHALARTSGLLRLVLAEVRRVEHHQQTLINWLLPPDLSPLELTLGYEQTAIEITAHVAQHEPDSYMAQVYRFGMLEDFDHLYRYAALYDRIYGGDANTVLQSYTDVLPGRPTGVQHRAPEDDLRRPYDRQAAAPLSKLNALTIVSAEHQVRDYYMNIGPTFADPVARQLYAEIASVEEQHVTQYESLLDPAQSPLEQWLLHEASEVYNYYGCMISESCPRVRAIWERFLQYELGHLHLVMDLMQRLEDRDPMSILPSVLPAPVEYHSHRQFIREVLRTEVDLRARGKEFVSKEDESEATGRYRGRINQAGSPSQSVATGYHYTPATELAACTSKKAQRGYDGRFSHAVR